MGEGNDLGAAGSLHALQLDAQGLGLGAGVDHLDDDLTSLLVEYGRGEETVLAFLTCHGLALHGEREHIGALVHGIELLDIVADRLEHAEVVEPDGIGTPLPTLDMSEERSVGGHVDDVGITLNTRHVGSL